jgi:hypothetical protein
MTVRRPLIASLALLVLAACANGTTGSATTQVGLADNGHTITLRPGDTLRVSLPPKGDTTWNVSEVPPSALHLDSADPATGVFTFTVDGTGGGRLVALFGPACGPGVVGATPTPSCVPVGKEAPVDPVAGHLPAPDVFSISIVVSGAS